MTPTWDVPATHSQYGGFQHSYDGGGMVMGVEDRWEAAVEFLNYDNYGDDVPNVEVPLLVFAVALSLELREYGFHSDDDDAWMSECDAVMCQCEESGGWCGVLWTHLGWWSEVDPDWWWGRSHIDDMLEAA